MGTTGTMGGGTTMMVPDTYTGPATTNREDIIATTTIVHGGTAIGITGNLIAAGALPPVAIF